MILTKDKGKRMWGGGFGNGSGGSGGGGGGGSVALGPLLTSLNAEAMPSAEGYLHWTGSDWDFTSIDLSSYATEAWVLQQGYVTSSAISDMATETWVLQQGYITESAVSNAWKVKDVQVVDNNSLVINGEDVIYGAVLASNGMLTLNRTRLSIYVPEYTSDLVNDSGFIDQTGGTIESLTVTNDLDADSITVGSIVNSNTLAEYLDADAMQTWLQQQGYITESAVSNAWKVKDVQVVADNGLVLNGEDVIYDAELASNGMLTLKSTRLSIAVPEYTSDLVNDSGFIDQTTADGRYLQLSGGTLKGQLTFADSIGNSYGAIRAEKIENDEYLYLWGNDGVLINGLSVRKDNEIVQIEDVFLNLTGGTMEPGATITLQEIVNNIPVQTLVASQRWVNAQGYITQTTADGRYIKGVSVYGSSLNPDTNSVVNIPYADINTPGVIQIGSGLLNSEGHTEVDTSVIASRQWANGQFVTALGVSGDNLTYTKNGAATNITVPFATRTMGFKRLNVTGSQIADANTRTVDGVTYALLSNYASTDLWANMPSGMSWGNVLQLASATSLDGQLAWDSNHGVTTGVTRKLYWRSRNSSGWGTNGWHTIAFEDWVTSQLNTLGDNLQSYVTTQLAGYLPLTAGSSKPLTGNIAYKGTKATYDMITFIDNKVDQWGNGIAIGGGGATIIGGGESAGTMSAQVSGGSEAMYIGNDQGVSIFTNLQNGWDYRKEFTFHNTGVLSAAGSVVTPNGSGLYIKDTGGTERVAVFVNNINQFFVGLGMRNAGYVGYFDSNIMYLRSGASGTTMTLDASNNVGIGTTSPSCKLDVNGIAKANYVLFKNYNDNGNAGYCGRGTSSSNDIYLMSYAANVHIGANSSSNDIYINTSHNVGIGITPQAKLHVNGNVRISGTLTGVTNIDGLMIFDSTNNKVTVGTLDVTTLGMTSISVGENGYKMSVTSDDYGVTFNGATDGDYIFMWNSTTRGNIYAGSGDFSGNLTVGNRPADADQKLYVGGSAVITGSVGIGTRPTGSYAVEVDGSVYATSFVNGSDIRMKDVTRYIEPSVHDIAIAPIIEFKWKKGDGSKNIGSIAQYWQTVFPQAVHEGGDGMLSIEYANIALASAITAARHSLDNERRIAELELRVAELEDELAAMVSQQGETTYN